MSDRTPKPAGDTVDADDIAGAAAVEETLHPHQDTTMTLGDGRTLAHAHYGDPGGRPLLYFHGHPGSRYEAALLHEVARDAGVLVIGTDRPGMGRSSFQRHRSILDWPGDVAQLADQLGLGHFAVLGISGGGPYAAACALRLPDRITTCTLLSSASPTGLDSTAGGQEDDIGEHGLAANRLQARLVRFAPWLLRPAFTILAHSIELQNERNGPADTARAALRALPQVDRAAMADPMLASRYGRSLVEAVRQGGRGPAWEARLLARPWGFEPASINGPMVHVWHGELDRNVPVGAGRAMAAAIPGASVNIHAGHGHLSLAIAHLPTILATATTPTTTTHTTTTPHGQDRIGRGSPPRSGQLDE